MRRLALALFAASAAWAGAAAPLAAQGLRIAMAGETTSADPHQYGLTPNTTLRGHLFNALTETAPDLSATPGLAARWERESDTSWLFHLRPGVTFHDGSAFTAEDVVASFCRTRNNDGEVTQSFSRYVRGFAKVETPDAMTVRIVTREPAPLLPSDLSNIAIIPRRLVPAGTLDFQANQQCGVTGSWPTAQDFNEGRASVGTGPYRFVSYTRGGAIELARFDGYWGPRPHWATVRLTPVTAAAPRLAGLLAGDHDLIEAPNTADLARLRSNAAVHVSASPTTRLIFLQFDTARSPSPFVQGGSGRNPLQDARVRQALSLAIDRKALAERVMDGVALPAAQFLPEGMAGTIPGLPVLPYDPGRARALLAEAGYPQGFALTFHATNNRYVNDARLAQAIVQYWQRIGVKAELDTMPSATFFTRRARREFSIAMGGWSADAAETLLFQQPWLMTTDASRGRGSSNYGGWSDPAFDGTLNRAIATMDPEARAGLLRESGSRALQEMPVVPIHFESATWASRRGFRYPGRVDQTTLAAEVLPE
ncbi:peptide/nickel transport system substrate-binding protein [Roseomonas rosea]|uniref:Peptide/nickel transport system substrate-binding protein n=1 Tax=Muricoccus roseus TaxID=198092 RepID=A0A1M6F171_9PROT|nr:ABC transporter substrate-binding protein [Roseomonas rosea]SHI91406.1 peptide/nickel transport system substrate-binding protein [Roseomonas rosea]